MAIWEITILVIGTVIGFILAMFFERDLHNLILRVVADSLLRVLGLLVAVLVPGLVLGAVLIQLLPKWYQAAPTITVLGTAIFFIGAFVVIMPFFPGTVPSLTGAGSSRRELQKSGGSGRVSIALGWGGALAALMLFGFTVLGPALVLIDP
ncbi:hypothetical protein [Nocardiopsis salina]|uniref:hypothetical protein n=1 Tax=Nocardiopsis salina TaxID=245836 RepID=UPI00036F3946|nr:hypothetical protein [Nocardiopsis salina]